MARNLSWGAGIANLAMPAETDGYKTVARFLHNWYRLLVGTWGGAGWTVLGSSAGGVGAMDGVDRWAAVTDMTNLVYQAGVKYPWILLRSPTALGTKTVYILLTPGTTASNGYHESVISRMEAPAGGSGTAAPTFTALNKRTAIGGSSQAGAVGQALYNSIGPVPRRFHGMLSTRGDFVWMGSKNGISGFEVICIFEKVADPQPNDEFPYFLAMQMNTSYSPGGTIANGALSDASQNYSAALLPTGLSLGTITTTVGPLYGLYGYTNTSNTAPTIDRDTGMPLRVPMWVFAAVSSVTGHTYRGRTNDVLFSAGRTLFTTTPANNSEYVYTGPTSQNGGVWLPYPTGMTPDNGP